jgi:RHS repeat-associated protein
MVISDPQLDCVTSTTCWEAGQGGEGIQFSETTNAGVSWSAPQLAPDPLTGLWGGLACQWDVACFFGGTTALQFGPAIESTTGISPADGGPLTLGELLGGFNPAEGCLACELRSLGLEQLVGDPVNTATGDLSESATDISVPTYGPSLSFSRTYDADAAQQETSAGQMGLGWTDNWATSAEPNVPASGDVTIVQSNGSQVSFYPYTTSCPIAGQLAPGSGSNNALATYCVAPRVQAWLTVNGSGDYVFNLQDGTSYTYGSSGTVRALIAVTSSSGASVALSAGATSCPSPAVSCETITGADGSQHIVLGFSAASQTGQIVTARDPLGRTWTYGYCPAISSTCRPGDLISVTDPMSRVTTYTYDAGDSMTTLRGDLTSVTTPRFVADVPTAAAIAAFCAGGSAPAGATVNCYDSLGFVIEQADPMGRVTQWAYSGSALSATGGSTMVTDPDGNETLYNYLDGELTSTTTGYGTAAAATWSYFRDPATLLPTAVVDPDGDVTTMTYLDGDLTSVTNPLGNTSNYLNNPLGEVTCAAASEATGTACNSAPTDIAVGTTTITPPAAPPAFATYTQYDDDGDLVWTSTGEYAPGGSTASPSTSYELHNGQSVMIAGATYSCSAVAPTYSGLPCATVDPAALDTETTSDQAVTQLGYDTDGDLTSSSIPDGNSGGELATTTWSYDADGELQSVVSPLGNLSGGANAAKYTTGYIYDTDGEVTQVDESSSTAERKSYYGYDADGNRNSVENPVTGTTSTTFDADEEPTFSTDADGNSSLTCYDGDGNVTEVVPPVGVATGSLTSTSCPSPLADPASESAAAGEALATDATLSSYDDLGDPTAVYSPAPAPATESFETTTSTYDAAGRLVETVAPSTDPTNDPGGLVTLDNYDAAGELLASSTGTGSSLAVTSQCYDLDGNETAIVPPDGNAGASVGPNGLTLTGYAACSGTSPYQTTSGYQTGYTYDSTGNLLTRTRPGSAVTTDTYDADGQLVTSTSPKSVETTLTYTPLGETASETYSDGTHSVSDTYDANGELTQMVDGTGTSTMAYDAFSDLSSYENGAGEQVSYTYNGLGEPLKITYPLPGGTTWDSTSSVNYTYDDAGLLTNLADLEGHNIGFAYTADELAKTISLPTAVGSEAVAYDNADDVQSVVFTKGSTTLSYAYTRQPSGDVAGETDSQTGTDASPSYNYDSLDRVTKLTPVSGSSTTYAYDASSNLTTPPGDASATYNDSSELCWTDTSSSSNACGSPPTGSVAYTFDADGNRLTAKEGSTTLASASWNGIDELTAYDATTDMTAAAYDGNGLRQSDTVGSVTQGFVWDTATSVPELLEDGSNLYIYGLSGTPIEQMSLSTGSRTYLISDALGSVRGVIGSSGVILAKTSYDAYGLAGSTTVAADTPFGFAGGYTDATGLVYLINRYYDPGTGQFLSMDPLVDETDQAYGYTGGDPVDGTDLSGLYAASSSAGTCILKDFGACPTFGQLASSGDACGAFLNANFIGSDESSLCATPNPCGQSVLCSAEALGEASSFFFGIPDIDSVVGGVLGLCDFASSARDFLAGGAAEDAGLSSVEQQTFDDVANNPNNLDHVFAEKHNFGDLINQFGSQQNVLKQMILSLRSASLPEAGVFNTVVDLGGTSVEVNGAVVNGVPRIGTAWVVK